MMENYKGHNLASALAVNMMPMIQVNKSLKPLKSSRSSKIPRANKVKKTDKESKLWRRFMAARRDLMITSRALNQQAMVICLDGDDPSKVAHASTTSSILLQSAFSKEMRQTLVTTTQQKLITSAEFIKKYLKDIKEQYGKPGGKTIGTISGMKKDQIDDCLITYYTLGYYIDPLILDYLLSLDPRPKLLKDFIDNGARLPHQLIYWDPKKKPNFVSTVILGEADGRANPEVISKKVANLSKKKTPDGDSKSLKAPRSRQHDGLDSDVVVV